MSVYEELGVPKVINAYGTLTRLGGSLMPPEVLQAMNEAARQYVELPQFKARVGQRIAELTRNEAAHVCCGAAAGLVVATAACITGADPALVARLPSLEGLKDEVVVFRSQRNGYDLAVRQVGVRLREVGAPEGREIQPSDLEEAIGPQTAAVFFFAGGHFRKGALSLEQTVGIAHRAGVPVVVDAAAQLPPMENLWRFTQIGADLVIFSGGKGLCGPQSSGLIVGRKEMVQACALHDSPNHAIGRPMKVGKEELAGLLAAVKWFLGPEYQARAERWERQTGYLIQELSGIPGVGAERNYPGEAGNTIARVRVKLDKALLGRTAEEVIEALRSGDPVIESGPAQGDGFFINPQTLEEGEERAIVARLREIAVGQPV